MKPLVKYRGGKTRDIPYFEAFIPRSYDWYFEPFLGGGASFFHLEPERAVLGDINAPLVDFYLAVRNNFQSLSAELKTIQKIYDENQKVFELEKIKHPNDRIQNQNEAFYYDLRNQFNGIDVGKYSRAALYYFINKTAYSGMIRYNAQGHFNVPFGRYSNFNTGLITESHSLLLQRSKLLNVDYSILFGMARQNDFMFLDPPYDCVFNDYGNYEMANGFGEQEHRRLAVFFRQLECKALMVIGKTKLTEELYSGFIRAEYGKDYAVNIRNRFHSRAIHIIVTNYEV